MSFNSNDYKGFTFRSGPSKNKTKSFSSFWDTSSDNDVDSFLGIDEDKPKGKDIVALSGYKRAIGNFVNIVTGKNIPVTFNNNDESFTDGKKVVIGSNLNEKNFDVAVGLALHEGSHISLSDFNLLKQLEMEIPEELYVIGDNKNVSRNNVIQMVKSVLNYVEDRRIDTDTFKSSPGYKGYYHSMYNKYFYSKNVDKGLLSSEMRIEDIDSYMFRIINLHNKNRQLGSLKGLKEIYNLVELWNISRLEDTRMALNVALEVSRVVLNSIDKVKVEGNSDTNTDGMSGLDGEGDDGNSDGGGNGGSDDNTLSDEEFDSLLDSVENGEDSSDGSGSGGGKSVEAPVGMGGNGSSNDDGSTPVELSDRQKEQLRKAFEKQKDFVDGNINKTKLSKKDNNSVKAIEESGASYENVGDGIQTNRWDYNSFGKGTKCLVVRKLTQGLIDSNIFGCATSWRQKNYNDTNRYGSSYNFVEEGLRLGTMLGRKLQVRGEESSLKYSRKDSGKIDKRLLSELGFGNSNVFSQTFVERFNKAYLHISVDASGSMSGDKWNKAMTSAVAMIKACDMAGNIDVVVSIRATHGRHYNDVPMIMVVYDSRTDKLTKVKTLFTALDVDGTTPEGLCFEAIEKELIPGNNNQDSYFVNYSDGQPYYGNSEINYSGESAERHTAKMVNNMRAKGINVLSYFISGKHDYDDENRAFKNMYGNDASFINATNMMEVAKTMNKKFLEK